MVVESHKINQPNKCHNIYIIYAMYCCFLILKSYLISIHFIIDYNGIS